MKAPCPKPVYEIGDVRRLRAHERWLKRNVLILSWQVRAHGEIALIRKQRMATFSCELGSTLSILTVFPHADMLASRFPHSVRSRIISTGSLRSTMRLGKGSVSSLTCLNTTIMGRLDAFKYHHCSHLLRTQMALFSSSLKRCQVIFIMSLHSDRTTGVRCCVIDRNSCLGMSATVSQGGEGVVAIGSATISCLCLRRIFS